MSTKPEESDVAFIRALAELLRDNDLSEIEVRRQSGEEISLNVRVARTRSEAPVMAQAPVQAMALPAPGPADLHASRPAVGTSGDPSDDPGVVPSPMVGTVYMQAEPGSPAFVRVGDSVAEGQTLLIIEAMKTMNQIPAPRAGRVKRILVEDGSPVEFGAPLVILE